MFRKPELALTFCDILGTRWRIDRTLWIPSVEGQGGIDKACIAQVLQSLVKQTAALKNQVGGLFGVPKQAVREVENHLALIGKSTINGQFSIAILNYQRVGLSIQVLTSPFACASFLDCSEKDTGSVNLSNKLVTKALYLQMWGAPWISATRPTDCNSISVVWYPTFEV